MPASRTIGDHLEYLLSGLSRRRRPPNWPPDVFAIVGSILHSTGGYCVAATSWPPSKDPGAWAPMIQNLAKKWRADFNNPPIKVRSWWNEVRRHLKTPLEDVKGNTRLCRALLQLLAAADQASAGAGIPSTPDELDEFDFKAGSLLVSRENGSSLCEEIAGSNVRVLPKTHAPQSGLTLRSFSHHLGLVIGNEIQPFWYTVGGSREAKDFAILVIPWPKRVRAADFRGVNSNRALMKNLPKKFGFFEFRHVNPDSLVHEVLTLYQRATQACERVDVIVMPECSISDEEYDKINSILLPQGVLLIAGIGDTRDDGTNQNFVRYNIPVAGHQVPIRQGKHHRWKLDQGQILTYGLDLNERRIWWEHIPLGDRSLSFVSLHSWLSMCVLICEDLARPDPVGDLIRAVGPNLVIALLLDGPQLETRWPGRYATTLADDPGCSVLTLSSVGMAKLSKPPRLRGAKTNHEVVALWKDVRGKAQTINLQGREAAVLHVSVQEREEWTADGRSDRGATGYPLLRKVTLLGGKKLREYDV